MKSMLKSELAREAGVSVRTLNRWCEMYREELIAMGWRPRMKLLPPKKLTKTAKNGRKLTETDNGLLTFRNFASRKGNSLCSPKSKPDTR